MIADMQREKFSAFHVVRPESKFATVIGARKCEQYKNVLKNEI